MKRLLCAAAMLAAATCAPALAADDPGPLASTEWLASNLNRKDLVILDVRGDGDTFAARRPDRETPGVWGHVPGARFWPYSKMRETREVNGVKLKKMAPTRERFEAMMRALGVENDSLVVLMASFEDSGSVTIGTRAYWTLKYFGHERVTLVDGGIEKWAIEDRPLVVETPPVAVTHYLARSERRELLADARDVEAVLAARQGRMLPVANQPAPPLPTLVDGRTADYYVGQSVSGDVKARGHIPGAKMLAHVELLQEDRYGFRSADELRKLAGEMGVDPAKPSISYCNTGHLASGSWFVLHELLGQRGARLYDGSMHEWTMPGTRPVTRKWEME